MLSNIVRKRRRTKDLNVLAPKQLKIPTSNIVNILAQVPNFWMPINKLANKLSCGVLQLETLLKNNHNIFFLHETHSVLLVKLFPRFSICSNYVNQKICKNENCTDFHICMKHLAKLCSEENCNYSHSLKDRHNIGVFRSFHCDKIPSDYLVKYFTSRFPFIKLPSLCSDLPDFLCAPHQACEQIHLCPDMCITVNKCFRVKCKFPHEWFSVQNRKIMDEYRIQDFTNSDPDIKSLISMQGFQVMKSRRTENDDTEKETLADISEKYELFESKNVIARRIIKILFERTSYWTAIETLNEIMCCNEEKLTQTISTFDHLFLVYETQNRKFIRFRATFEICDNSMESHCDQFCDKIHLCKNFLRGECEDICTLSHSLNTPHNLHIFATYLMDDISIDLIMEYIKMKFKLTPKLLVVCLRYNMSNCQSCDKIHVCYWHLFSDGHCQLPHCSLEHSLSSHHNKEIIDKHNLGSIPEKELAAVMSMNLFKYPSTKLIDCRLEPLDINFDKEVQTMQSVKPKNSENVSNTSPSANSSHQALFSGALAGSVLISVAGSSDVNLTKLDKKSNARKVVNFLLNSKHYWHSSSIISRAIDIPINDLNSLIHVYKNVFCVLTIESMKLIQLRPDFKICSRYDTKHGCSKKSCLQIHICKDFLRRQCKTKSCPFYHDLSNDHNQKVLEKYLLNNVQKRVLMTYVHCRYSIFSVPKVCIEYNRRKCNEQNCKNLHICHCKLFTLSYCFYDNCTLEHNLSCPQLTPFNEEKLAQQGRKNDAWRSISLKLSQFVLPSRYNLLNNNTVTVYENNFEVPMTVLDLQHVGTNCTEAQSSCNVASFKQTELIMRKDNMPGGMNQTKKTNHHSQNIREFTPIKSLFSIPEQMNPVRKVVEYLIESPDFWASSEELAKVLQCTLECLHKLVSDHNGIFYSYASNKKSFPLIKLRPLLKLCSKYKNTPGCVYATCSSLHVCHKYVSGECSDEYCELSHDLNDKVNKAALAKFYMEKITSRVLTRYIKMRFSFHSMPKICFLYSLKNCSNTDCDKIHICYSKLFTNSYCLEPLDCKLEHSLLSEHNQNVISRYKLKSLPLSQISSLMSFHISHIPTDLEIRPAVLRRRNKKQLPIKQNIEQTPIPPMKKSYLPPRVKYSEEKIRFETKAVLGPLCSLNEQEKLVSSIVKYLIMIRNFSSCAKSLVEVLSCDEFSIRSLVASYPEVFFSFKCGTRMFIQLRPHLQFCSEYSILPVDCKKQACYNLHICPGVFTKKCSKGILCKYSHKLRDEHNKLSLWKYFLNDIPHIFIEKYLNYRYPFIPIPPICLVKECDGNLCYNQIHMCVVKLFTRHNCFNEDCKNNHDLFTEENSKVIQSYVDLRNYSDDEIWSILSLHLPSVPIDANFIEPSYIKLLQQSHEQHRQTLEKAKKIDILVNWENSYNFKYYDTSLRILQLLNLP